MSEIKLTKENFDAEVLNSNKKVLVDFWASWCAPCMMLSPIVSEIAEESKGEFIVGKVNIDEDGTLAQNYGIVSIPTLIVFKNGKIHKTAVGYMPKEEILKLLED